MRGHDDKRSHLPQPSRVPKVNTRARKGSRDNGDIRSYVLPLQQTLSHRSVVQNGMSMGGGIVLTGLCIGRWTQVSVTDSLSTLNNLVASRLGRGKTKPLEYPFSDPLPPLSVRRNNLSSQRTGQTERPFQPQHDDRWTVKRAGSSPCSPILFSISPTVPPRGVQPSGGFSLVSNFTTWHRQRPVFNDRYDRLEA